MKRKIFRAGMWTMLGYGASQVVRFGTNLVMTRLLAPEMFGVMAIALTFMFGLTLFSDLGIRQNVVQSQRGDDPAFLGTAWAVQVVRGGILFFFALLISVVLFFLQEVFLSEGSSVYGDPMLPRVIAVLAFTALIAGFESINLATASRRLELGRATMLDLIAQCLAIPAMLVWANYDRSIWVLVSGAVVAAVVRAILSHLFLHGPRICWVWETAAVKEIIGFGKWIFLSSILGFFVMSADRLLLGSFVGADVLGMYAIAYLIINAVQQGLWKLSVGVALPALSEVFRRGAIDAGRAMYYKGRLPFDLASLFTAGFLWTSGKAIVSLLYDARYWQAGHILEVLALTLVAIRYDVAEKCFMAMGKPKYLTVLNFVRLTSLCIAVPFGFAWGDFDGALWSLVIAAGVGLLVLLSMTAKEGLLDKRREIRVLPVFLVGAVIGQGVSLWVGR